MSESSNLSQAGKHAELTAGVPLSGGKRGSKKKRHSHSFYRQLMCQDWYTRVKGRIRQKGWRW
ncbi:hypothetical protein [Ferviditalea candida]|uniref:Uncharacterized protein n=1 Tax=Ferviditalea candida TaxID=3108399 RepID=A0ABU5ZK20_9BACL|nr:hypothetical protein [Paenibacillaceae bacterium T2]